MTFSLAQYEAVITRLNDGINKLPPAANAAVQRIDSEYSWIPIVGPLLVDALKKFVSLMDRLLRKLEEYAMSSAVPIAMWIDGDSWLKIQQQMGTMAGDIAGQVQANQSEWTGLASGRYATGVGLQAPAVQEISSLAGTTSGACTQIAYCGLGFYLALIGAIVALAFAIATSETGVGLVAGVVAAIMAVGTAAGLFFLGVQSQAGVLEGMVGGNANMPNGSWPVARSS